MPVRHYLLVVLSPTIEKSSCFEPNIMIFLPLFVVAWFDPLPWFDYLKKMLPNGSNKCNSGSATLNICYPNTSYSCCSAIFDFVKFQNAEPGRTRAGGPGKQLITWNAEFNAYLCFFLYKAFPYVQSNDLKLLNYLQPQVQSSNEKNRVLHTRHATGSQHIWWTSFLVKIRPLWKMWIRPSHDMKCAKGFCSQNFITITFKYL